MSIKTTLANDKSQQHDLQYTASCLSWRKLAQFTGRNYEVVLLFQSVTENIVCCGDLINMLLVLFKEIKFTTFFARKYGIGK